MGDVRVIDLAKDGITLTDFGSQSFRDKLQIISRGRDTASIDKILPYSVIVENKSRLPIAAITIRAELQGQDGRTITHQMTAQHLDTRNPAGFFQPGQLRLISPVPQVDSVMMSTSGIDLPASVGTRVEERRSLYSVQRIVTFSVDCVVFADGRQVGADKSKTAKRIAAIVAAEKDMVAELRRSADTLQLARLHLSEILAMPEKTAASLAGVDPYDRARRQLARWLSMQLERLQSDQSFHALLTALDNKPSIVVRKAD